MYKLLDSRGFQELEQVGPYRLVRPAAQAVWGEGAPATAAHVVRTYVSNLKPAIDGRIRSDGNHYGIDTSRSARL